MKAIIKYAANYPVTVSMCVLGVLLLGYLSFDRLGMDLFPELNNPRLYIELESGERPPEEIEKQFVLTLEALAMQQEDVERVYTVVRTGSARIMVEYSWNADMGDAYLKLQEAIADYGQNDDIDDISVSQYDPNAVPIILLGLTNPDITDMDVIRRVAENYLQSELMRLEGIADVRLLGTETKEVDIETDDYMLEAFGITPSEISSRIQDYNRTVSAGTLVESGQQYVIKGVAAFTSLEDIESIVVAHKSPETQSTSEESSVADRAPVYLRDVATVKLEPRRPDNIVRLNGKRSVALALYKETQYNTVRVVDRFMEELPQLRAALPGYEITVIKNTGSFITNAISEVQQTLMVGILFAVLILYVFLRRIGATLIVSAAIPVSLVATFNLMYFKGLTLNIMTLGGLALGAGMLVDNAIVVVESIFRHREEGDSPLEAAIQGTAEVGGAITAATLTTIVVFLPIVYLHGAASELFKDQAWTVAFSLLSSLVVAIVFIPMLGARYLHSTGRAVSEMHVRYPRYRTLLNALIGKSWLVALAAIAIIAGSALLIPHIGSEFLPKTDTSEFVIDMKLPSGTELYSTDEVVESVTTKAREVFGDYLVNVYSVAGTDDTSENYDQTVAEDENTASITLIFAGKTPYTSDLIIARLTDVMAEIPDVESSVAASESALDVSLGTTSAPLEIIVKGEEMDRLMDLTAEVMSKLGDIPDLYALESSFDEGRPEVTVVYDRTRAGEYDISINTLGTQITNRLNGTDAGQWEDDGELRDITINLPDVSLNSLGGLTVESGSTSIPIYEIADIRMDTAPLEILRENQTRIGKISARITGERPLDHIVQDIQSHLESISFPGGYTYEISGEERQRRESFESLTFALLLSIVLVYMVMASQFESLVHPFTVIFSIPLAGAGTALLFFLLGRPLNIMAYIGVIMLAGIAVNDAIILVDAINRLKRSGLQRREAILQAAQIRLRPIVMTSLTTILALLPLTFGVGEGSELRSPMAYAVIGGLTTSTLLTLVVIPCMYDLIDRFSGAVVSRVTGR